jgi:membrane protease YdiL (CAAX protease family)
MLEPLRRASPLSTPSDSLRGVQTYVVVVLVGTTIIAVVMHAVHVSVGEVRSQGFILAAMWMPGFARLVATRTVDRGWHSPFPLRRWGHPAWIVVILPLASVTAIYLGAYLLAALAGVERFSPAWSRGRLVANILVNLPLLSAIGIVGALGEEIGWRGYLQPRLDELKVPYSLLWTIVAETLFHFPLILLAGYLGAKNLLVTLALFFTLGLGLTPLWTWATYQWGTIWMAVLFHTFHNAVSQVIIPKALGEGDPLVLGESGVFPVIAYLTAGLIVFVIIRRRGRTWQLFARSAIATNNRRVRH